MAFRSKTDNVTIVSGTTSVGTMPAGVTTGDRVFAFIGSGGANPNTLTAPSGWTKLGEYAPTGFLKTSVFYVDIAAGNATSHAAGTTHTWTFTSAGRNFAVLEAYSGTDLTRAPAWAGASGTADSAGPHNVPPLTIPANDWELIFAAARESPGTDDPKTWTISGGTGDVERVDAYGTNSGTGAKLAVAAYDTNAAASGGGGGSTVTLTGAPPTNTFNALTLTSSMKVGATVKSEDLSYWSPKLAGNAWMRIFPNSNGLPPDWEDSRFGFIRDFGGDPFLSSKIDGDPAKLATLSGYLQAMPSAAPWIYNTAGRYVWITDRHEPEGDVSAAAFIANFTAFWNMIQALPAGIRAKVKAGPVLTRQYTENTAGRSYATHDPGVGDFFGVDMYGNSWSASNASAVTTAYVDPVTFCSKVKAYNTGGRPKCFPELGYIGANFDTTGTARAAWLQGVHDEVATWGDFIGFIWWDAEGKSGTSLTGAGTKRWFQFDRRHTGTDGSYAIIPDQTTTVSVGSGGGSGSARTVTLSKPAGNTHVWSATIPMPAPAAPTPVNPWSCMGLPQR